MWPGQILEACLRLCRLVCMAMYGCVEFCRGTYVVAL